MLKERIHKSSVDTSNNIRQRIISEINALSVERLTELQSYIDFLNFKKMNNTPLDDYDYKLAERADKNKNEETFSFDQVMRECGLDYADLQD